MSGAPDVQLIASRPQDQVVGQQSNPSLVLANALAGVNDNLQPVLENIAKVGQAKAAAKANADALSTSGASFADAVRDGRIEKTQNPWYIQAYEKSAAAVRSREDVSTLIDQSQTWAEKSDPAKYQARFQQELGQIAEKYQGIDQAAGFRSSADPLAQQAVQQNVQYNVSRINEEHVQNVSTMATTNILAAAQAAGGSPSPAQVFASIEPQHKMWLDTGGTESDWNQITINSVIAAGYNSGNAQLLRVLDDERGGKGALANIAGPDGKPVAQNLATDRYRIEQEVEAKGMGAIKGMRAQIELKGLNGAQEIWDHFGTDFLQGRTSKADIESFLSTKGYSPQEIAAAEGNLGATLTKQDALTRALMGGNPEVLSLYDRANREGYTPKLKADIFSMVQAGTIDVKEATSLESAATSRSNHLESEARSDARSARSDARAAEREAEHQTVQAAKELKASRGITSSTVATSLAAAGIRTLVAPKNRAQFDKMLLDTENTAIAHGAAPAEAAKARDEAANAYVNALIAKHSHTGPKPASGSGNNPRGH